MRHAATPDRQLVATAPVSARAFRSYAAWTDRELNFEPIHLEQARADPAWHVDERCAELPAEQAGAPQPAGPFAVARDVLIDYEFADPSLVRAVYDPTTELEGRTMLLVGRFLGLRFHMGVRIAGVLDERTELDDQPVHRFRWHYRTLEGHLERGHMDYEILKWVETGAVQFRIRAYSQRARIRNPIVRAGFRVFGRWAQLRFYDRSLRRMQTFVAARAAASD